MFLLDFQNCSNISNDFRDRRDWRCQTNCIASELTLQELLHSNLKKKKSKSCQDSTKIKEYYHFDLVALAEWSDAPMSVLS